MVVAVGEQEIKTPPVLPLFRRAARKDLPVSAAESKFFLALDREGASIAEVTREGESGRDLTVLWTLKAFAAAFMERLEDARPALNLFDALTESMDEKPRVVRMRLCKGGQLL